MSPQNNKASQSNNLKSISEDAFMQATVGSDTFGIPPRDDLPKPTENMDVDGVEETGHYGWEDIGLKDTIFETINDEDSLFNISFNPPLTAKERYRQACLNTLYRDPRPVIIMIDLTTENDTNHAETVNTSNVMNGTRIELPIRHSPPRGSRLSRSPPKKAGHQTSNSIRQNSPNRSPNGESSRESQQLGPQSNEGRIKKQYKSSLTASFKQFTRQQLQQSPDAFKGEWYKTQDATPTRRMSYVKLLKNENNNVSRRN
ncbi:hypothetical protein EMPG_12997 [Blastomyces silverae]|uniref:Uncharacterized protein n=1 Tax=Blastomyces silverae TaxID=2060906 RepID=A0A0H1BKL4_9EURO|nr:hypothetical protein EMPG_12997 [Blastomyces silverae]